MKHDVWFVRFHFNSLAVRFTALIMSVCFVLSVCLHVLLLVCVCIRVGLRQIVEQITSNQFSSSESNYDSYRLSESLGLYLLHIR